MLNLLGLECMSAHALSHLTCFLVSSECLNVSKLGCLLCYGASVILWGPRSDGGGIAWLLSNHPACEGSVAFLSPQGRGLGAHF